jgi:hypothetical protein
VTEDVGLEYDTFTNPECSSPLYPRLRDFKKFSNGNDRVTGFDFVFHDTVLFVKMKITLSNIICWSSRTDKHHDFVVSFLTLFVGFGFVHFFGIV